jgi:hypothetical protein
LEIVSVDEKMLFSAEKSVHRMFWAIEVSHVTKKSRNRIMNRRKIKIVLGFRVKTAGKPE